PIHILYYLYYPVHLALPSFPTRRSSDLYRVQRGWGHSSLSDALAFAHRAGSANTLLFHHDPGHDDARLEAIGEEAASEWALRGRSEEHTSELQSLADLVCRLPLQKKNRA